MSDVEFKRFRKKKRDSKRVFVVRSEVRRRWHAAHRYTPTWTDAWRSLARDACPCQPPAWHSSVPFLSAIFFFDSNEKCSKIESKIRNQQIKKSRRENNRES